MLAKPEGLRVFGLTGGIAAGKSEVARVWRGLGIPVIDADQVSREQMLPGGSIYAAVAAEFGNVVLSPDKTIDRAALGSLVFADPDRRRRLEALTHAEVLREVERRLGTIAQTGCHLAVVEAALILETGLETQMDGLAVVIAPIDQRIRHAIVRDGMNEASVRARMSAQVGDERRQAASKAVLHNDRDLRTLRGRARSLAIEVLITRA